MSKQKFKFGDRVKGLGLVGTVKELEMDLPLPLKVMWDDPGYPCSGFTEDGRYFTRGEPCLELLERPKQKIKKTFYKAYMKSLFDSNTIVATVEYYKSKDDLLKACKDRTIVGIEEREFEIEDE